MRINADVSLDRAPHVSAPGQVAVITLLVLSIILLIAAAVSRISPDELHRAMDGLVPTEPAVMSIFTA